MSNVFYTRFRRPPEVTLSCPAEERMTKSEFKDDCDINKIIARYQRTGQLPDNAKAAAARYGDFSEVPPYQEMLDRIRAADELFAALPAKVRKEFDNDAGNFIRATQTVEGMKILHDLGLTKIVEEAKDAAAGKDTPTQPAAPSSDDGQAKTSDTTT